MYRVVYIDKDGNESEEHFFDEIVLTTVSFSGYSKGEVYTLNTFSSSDFAELKVTNCEKRTGQEA